MSWVFFSPLLNNPLDKSKNRPFNARSETVEENKLFHSSSRYKRCLKPSTGFFEKGFQIRKKNYAMIWLGGIWSRWCSLDGAEL